MLCYRPAIKDKHLTGREKMKFFGWIAALAAAGLAVPASAQLSDKDSFIEAVRNRDGNAAMELLNARGSLVVNGRNLRGETALLVAIGNRDSVWTQFLLQNGANPDLPDTDGETPLIAASRIGFIDAVDWLLDHGASVDGANRRGETALIVAVQQRQAPVVRMLLQKGADPDRSDAAAGYSARDYARRDTRSREILSLIESTRKKAERMDDFKLD